MQYRTNRPLVRFRRRYVIIRRETDHHTFNQTKEIHGLIQSRRSQLLAALILVSQRKRYCGDHIQIAHEMAEGISDS